MNWHSLNGDFKKAEFWLKHLQEQLSISFFILHCPFWPSAILLSPLWSEDWGGTKTVQEMHIVDAYLIYNDLFCLIFCLCFLHFLTICEAFALSSAQVFITAAKTWGSFSWVVIGNSASSYENVKVRLFFSMCISLLYLDCTLLFICYCLLSWDPSGICRAAPVGLFLLEPWIT